MWNLDEHLCLETMNFQLISPNEAYLGVGEPGTNFCPLIPLKLQNFSILGMFNYNSIASKLLKIRKKNLLTKHNRHTGPSEGKTPGMTPRSSLLRWGHFTWENPQISFDSFLGVFPGKMPQSYKDPSGSFSVT